MKTDLTINATSATDGKKVTNKISYVNPNITNNQAITLAQAICSLTTDSYTKTTRTDTSDCDASRTARTFSSLRITSSNNSQQELIQIDPSNIYTVNYPITKILDSNPELVFWVKSLSFSAEKKIPTVETTENFEEASWRTSTYISGGYNNCWTIRLKLNSYTTQTFNVKITFADDDKYAEATLDFTINIVSGE